MTDIIAHKTPSGVSLPIKDTGYLDALTTYRGETARLSLATQSLSGQITQGEHFDLSQNTEAYVVPNYYSDLYSKVIVIPHLIELGSIATRQVFTVQVWNANRHGVHLSAVKIEGGEGIEIKGERAPLKFNELAIKRWEISVNMNGPADIDCSITWSFTGSQSPVTLRITGSRSTDWSFFPDWSENVVENMEFKTTIHQSLTGAEQRIATRLSPRRTFEFRILTQGNERQRFESMLYAYGARVFSMPVFTQLTHLSSPAQSGDKEILVNTQGLDFQIGGRALLIEGDRKEMIELVSLSDTVIQVKRPVVGQWNSGAALYPLKPAILTDMPQLTRLSDDTAYAQVRLQIYEHNAWSDSVDHLPTYRGHPVLEPTSEWSEDITAQYTRLISILDNAASLPYRVDTAGIGFQVTNHHFSVSDINSQMKLRQLFYYLRGRQRAIWVASSTSDMTLVNDVVGKSIDIQSLDYTGILLGATGRKDIRIETVNGEIYYRRIVDSSQIDAQYERLALDGDALNLKKEDVAKISFLSLSRLESDNIGWTFITENIASITVSFRSLRDELEV